MFGLILADKVAPALSKIFEIAAISSGSMYSQHIFVTVPLPFVDYVKKVEKSLVQGFLQNKFH